MGSALSRVPWAPGTRGQGGDSNGAVLIDYKYPSFISHLCISHTLKYPITSVLPQVLTFYFFMPMEHCFNRCKLASDSTVLFTVCYRWKFKKNIVLFCDLS